MKYVSVTEARSQLPSLLNEAEGIVLTRQGQPVAVLVDIEEYRATQAMLALVREPERLAAILQAHQRIQAGDLGGAVAYPELDDEEADDTDVLKHPV